MSALHLFTHLLWYYFAFLLKKRVRWFQRIHHKLNEFRDRNDNFPLEPIRMIIIINIFREFIPFSTLYLNRKSTSASFIHGDWMLYSLLCRLHLIFQINLFHLHMFKNCLHSDLPVCDVDCEWFMIVFHHLVTHFQQLILHDLPNKFYFVAAMIEIWNFNEYHNNVVKTHKKWKYFELFLI